MCGGFPLALSRLRHVAVALGVLVCLIAAAFAVIRSVPAPQRQLEVKVRWAAGLTEPEKAAAARELGLSRIRVRDDGVWIVQPADSSRDYVRRFVSDPRVADTDDVDRGAYALRYMPQTWPQWFARRFPAVSQRIRRIELSTVGVPAVFAAVLLTLVVAGAYRAVTRSTPWIFRGVPVMAGQSLALFRIAYGTAMLIAARTLFSEITIPGQRDLDWWARTAFEEALRSDPRLFERIVEIVIVCLTLFVVGLVPRLSLAVATAGLICVEGVLLSRRSIHDWGLPTMTMALMTLVPWNCGFGLSQMLRRWRGVREPTPAIPPGLALWIPAFTMGVAFLAAAYAKLHTSGFEWITSGAVRYHFIDDSPNAPLDWGMRIATSDALSVAMSFGAIAVEATVWLVIWFSDWRVRLMLGAASASLLAGFFLFQGVFWPAWWTMLLAFLPWPLAADAAARRLPRFTVLIDGDCPLCRRTARVLHSLDWFDRIAFADAADDRERARLAPGLSRDAALAEMHVLDAHGARSAGYDGYLSLARSLPLLWIPRLVGTIPPAREIGRHLYARVAATRPRVGRCTDAVCEPGAAPLPRPAGIAPIVTGLRPILPAVFALVLAQQIIVSTLAVESQPFISNFPMYSHTYRTRQAFDAHLRSTPVYTIRTAALSAGEVQRRLTEFCDLDDVVYPAIELAIADAGADGTADNLRAVLRRYEAKYGEPLGPLSVVRRERRFDWRRGEFEHSPRVTFDGTVDLEEVATGT